jgi:hypothetical protein
VFRFVWGRIVKFTKPALLLDDQVTLLGRPLLFTMGKNFCGLLRYPLLKAK